MADKLKQEINSLVLKADGIEIPNSEVQLGAILPRKKEFELDISSGSHAPSLSKHFYRLPHLKARLDDNKFLRYTGFKIKLITTSGEAREISLPQRDVSSLFSEVATRLQKPFEAFYLSRDRVVLVSAENPPSFDALLPPDVPAELHVIFSRDAVIITAQGEAEPDSGVRAEYGTSPFYKEAQIQTVWPILQQMFPGHEILQDAHPCTGLLAPDLTLGAIATPAPEGSSEITPTALQIAVIPTERLQTFEITVQDSSPRQLRARRNATLADIFRALLPDLDNYSVTDSKDDEPVMEATMEEYLEFINEDTSQSDDLMPRFNFRGT